MNNHAEGLPPRPDVVDPAQYDPTNYWHMAAEPLIGAVAVAEANILSDDEELARSVQAFMNPEVAMRVEDQLEAMRAFWSRMGRTMPELPPELAERLSAEGFDHPSLRIVPAPLLTSAQDRQELVRTAARTIPGVESVSLQVAGSEGRNRFSTYSRLLHNPRFEDNNNGGHTVLRHAIQRGGRTRFVTAEELGAYLQETGQATTAADGTTWTFAITSVRTGHDFLRPVPGGELAGSIDPTMTVSTALTLNLMSHASGDTPPPRRAVNEFVCYVENGWYVTPLSKVEVTSRDGTMDLRSSDLSSPAPVADVRKLRRAPNWATLRLPKAA